MKWITFSETLLKYDVFKKDSDCVSGHAKKYATHCYSLNI